MNTEPRNVSNGEAVTIALMGATGSGKSTFVNLVSNSNFKVGHDLKSCTTRVAVSPVFGLDGVPVALIDTPGFDDTEVTDADILKNIASYLASSFEEGFKLSGILYFHRISDVRATGTAIRTYKMFKTLCGDNALKSVIIVTNMWSEIEKEVGEKRENELKVDNLLYKGVLQKGATMKRHDGTLESGRNIVRELIGKERVKLRIQEEIVEGKRDITQTDACGVLDGELKQLQREHAMGIEAAKAEWVKLLSLQDLGSKAKLRALREKLEGQVIDAERKRAELSEAFEREKEWSLEMVMYLRAMVEGRKNAEGKVAPVKEVWKAIIWELKRDINRDKDAAELMAAKLERQLRERKGNKHEVLLDILNAMEREADKMTVDA